MKLSIMFLRQATSSVAIVSLFLAATVVAAWSQGLESRRFRSDSFPLAVTVPPGWESFQGSELVEGEVLFLRSGPEAPVEGTVSIAAYYPGGSLSDLARRQTYHLVVEKAAPLTVNQPLKLRGVPGHKWVYQSRTEEGELMQFERIYLLLPPSVGGRRLLVFHAEGRPEQSVENLPLFNEIARSLAWGLASEVPAP